VGLTTFAIVFNMNYIASKIGGVYFPRRERLIKRMQQEEGWWSRLGKQFEEFKPSNEKRVPTEWWIPIYLIRRVLLALPWMQQEEASDAPEPSASLASADDSALRCSMSSHISSSEIRYVPAENPHDLSATYVSKGVVRDDADELRKMPTPGTFSSARKRQEVLSV
jgi:hypothetical protein